MKVVASKDDKGKAKTEVEEQTTAPDSDEDDDLLYRVFNIAKRKPKKKT